MCHIFSFFFLFFNFHIFIYRLNSSPLNVLKIWFIFWFHFTISFRNKTCFEKKKNSTPQPDLRPVILHLLREDPNILNAVIEECSKKIILCKSSLCTSMPPSYGEFYFFPSFFPFPFIIFPLIFFSFLFILFPSFFPFHLFFLTFFRSL